MTRALSPSPSYARPPVVEVALGAHFRPAVNLQSVHYGRLWELWRSQYPNTEDRPPLPPIVFEDFASDVFGRNIQIVIGSSDNRVVYLAADDGKLLQLQRDRLVLNWKKLPGQDYPRYETLRPAFEQALGTFVRFATEQGLGEIQIAQGIVTYVNPIPKSEIPKPGGLQALFAPWSGRRSNDFLPGEENTKVELRYLIPQPGSEEPRGRLYIEVSTASRLDATGEPEEIFLLTVYARGLTVDDHGVRGALDFLDVGHEWVVRGFTSITSAAMHKEWGREA